MKNFLESRIGKAIEVNCGAVSIRGTVMLIEGEVLFLEKDGVTCYVNIDKIIVVWDDRERKGNPPGFVINTTA